MKEKINPGDEENIIKMLDEFAATDELRMKVKMTDAGKPGQIKQGYMPGHLDNINTTIGSRNKVEFSHFEIK